MDDLLELDNISLIKFFIKMKRQLTSILLFSALLMWGASTFVSCTDHESDAAYNTSISIADAIAKQESDLTKLNEWLGELKTQNPTLADAIDARIKANWEAMDKVKDLLIMLEKDQLMKDILKAHLGDGLTVSIGQENDYSGIKDCSIITATYHLDGELLGSMAVLGPTRMEYGKTMSLLNYMNQNLTEVIKRLHW